MRKTVCVNLEDNPFYLNAKEKRWVEHILSEMTLEQKAGQIFCVMGGDYSPEELDKLVADYNVGGILFRPAPSEEIIKKYARVDKLASVPLLKAANLEEGGSGAVSDGTLFGWPMTIAAADDIKYARELADVCANEGKSVGINWTFSPVADINYNYGNPITHIRTFGSDPEHVLKYCSAYMERIQEEGIAACAKHFPGDGMDFRDQHLHPTYNTLPADQWYDTFGKVYKGLIDRGLLSIMAGHIVQPYVEMDVNPNLSLEECKPATLSSELLKGVLREKWGFNGLITSDATIMRGFNMAMNRADAIPSAVAAGCDMLVFNINFCEDYQYLFSGIERGILSEDRLDEAVTRILALKAVVQRKQEFTKRNVNNVDKSSKCIDQAVTLVKNTQNVFPITPEKFPEIELVTLGDTRTGEGDDLTDLVRERLEKEGFQVHLFQKDQNKKIETKKLEKSHLTIHLANMGAVSNNTADRLYWVQRGAQDAPRFVNEETEIFISFAYPYHLQDVPRVKTYINCYTCNRVAVKAVLDKILGKSEFTGISPVDAFCGLCDTRI